MKRPVFSRHLAGEKEENHEHIQRGITDSRARFGTCAATIRSCIEQRMYFDTEIL